MYTDLEKSVYLPIFFFCTENFASRVCPIRVNLSESMDKTDFPLVARMSLKRKLRVHMTHTTFARPTFFLHLCKADY